MSGLALTFVSAEVKDEPAKWLYLLEGVAACDALARLLAPFAVQQGQLTEVRYNESGGRFAVRLEVEGLTQQRAETLGERLRQFPIVASVSLGWRRLAVAEG